MKNLQKEDEDLKSTVQKQLDTIEEKRTAFKGQIKDAKDALGVISDECDFLRKTIFSLGHQLKRKVNSKEFEALKEVVDNWNLEGFMHHSELEKTWQKYAKE